jgi:prepilin-type processing-associated H-X9-DG protein/prepilin-type N-terminal cleavage/methylation domain-containing protein
MRSAFTLIECLVSIAIIGVLIAILFPVVSSVRRSARDTQCGSNMRQVGVAIQAHGSSRNQFAPLGGRVVADFASTARGSIAPLLQDSEKRRYSYVPAPPSFPFSEIVMPFHAALGRQLGTPPDVVQSLVAIDEAGAADITSWRVFSCPGVEDRPRASNLLEISSPDGANSIAVLLRLRCDFALNEPVFGFRPNESRLLAGQLSRIKRPSVVMLLADGGRVAASTISDGASLFWESNDSAVRPLTLGDALLGNGRVYSQRNLFDVRRHRGRMNLLFADGHVELRRIEPGELSSVVISDW